MKRILAQLLTPPLLWDVLAILGVVLVAVGLWCLWPPACLIALGMAMLAYAICSASLAQPVQREHRPRRREGRIEYIPTAQVLGRDVLLPELPDRGRLIDPAEDEDLGEWTVAE